MPKQNLAFALDYPRLTDVRQVLGQLANCIGFAKIGLELFTREGPASVREVLQHGIDVFLDLKLHDIPETVERAVAAACALDVRLLTVHCSGGPAMLERAVRRANSENPKLRVVGVTALTSLDSSDLAAIGLGDSPADYALGLARMAFGAGVRSFVCSPNEALHLRTSLGQTACLITPGVRPSGCALDDQKRAASPASAILNGADVLVIGRPIRDAADPAAKAKQIVEEIDQALRQRSQEVR